MAARTRIDSQQLPESGQSFSGTGAVTFSSADATNGNSCYNNGRKLILARNGDSSSTTITILGRTDENGRSANVTLTVPAFATPQSGNAIGGPYPEHLFGSDLNIDYSSGTALKIAIVELPYLI